MLRRIHYKISVFLLFAILGIGCFTVLMFTTGSSINNADRQVDESFKVINILRQVSSTLSRVETSFNSYLLSGDKLHADNTREAAATLYVQLDDLKQLTAGEPTQQLRLTTLQHWINKSADSRNAVLASPFSTKRIYNEANAKGIADSIGNLLTAINEGEQDRVKRSSTKIKQLSNGGLLIAIGGGIVYLFFALLLFYQFQRDSRLSKAAAQEILLREATYREMIDNAGLAMFTTDRPGNFTFVNQKMETITGFTTNEITGTHFAFVVAPEFRDIVTSSYREQYEKDLPELLISFAIITKDQQERWVEQHSILIKREGKIMGFQCIVKDITERKLAEVQLHAMQNERRESEHLLQATLDNMPVLMYIKDLDGKYLLTNKQFQKVAASGQAVLGKTDYDFNTREVADYNRAAERKVIETLEPLEQEYSIYKDSSIHHLLLVTFPIFDQHHSLIGTGGVATDITEKINRHEEVKRQKQHFEKAEQQLGRILAIFGAEIATHLNDFEKMSNALLATSLNPEQQHLVMKLSRLYDKLLNRAGNLNYILQIKSGQLPVRCVDFNVRKVMETVVAPLRARMKENDIELITGVHPEIPETMVGDGVHLAQIMSNLLETAMGSTKQGYIQLGAFPGSRHGAVSLRFVIRDNGDGIHESRLDHIFDPIPPEADSQNPEGNEIALRLYMTKQLIDFHKGTIDVSSSEGKGTTFNFSMPCNNLS